MQVKEKRDWEQKKLAGGGGERRSKWLSGWRNKFAAGDVVKVRFYPCELKRRCLSSTWSSVAAVRELDQVAEHLPLGVGVAGHLCC